MIEQAISYLLVFGAFFALDFVWAYYTKAVTERLEWRAAWWAVGITILSGIGQIGYVNDPALLIPAGLGAFAGTFAAIRRHVKAESKRA